jgi:hypothetical protein
VRYEAEETDSCMAHKRTTKSHPPAGTAIIDDKPIAKMGHPEQLYALTMVIAPLNR